MHHKNNNSRRLVRRSNRDGAILLDLFLATLIFAVCVIAIGQFGSQSLQLARSTSVERLAVLKAESILAKEIAHGPQKSPRVWKENLQNTPLTIRATWTETELPHLKRVTIEVAATQDLNLGRNTAALSQLVLVSEGK